MKFLETKQINMSLDQLKKNIQETLVSIFLFKCLDNVFLKGFHMQYIIFLNMYKYDINLLRKKRNNIVQTKKKFYKNKFRQLEKLSKNIQHTKQCKLYQGMVLCINIYEKMIFENSSDELIKTFINLIDRIIFIQKKMISTDSTDFEFF